MGRESIELESGCLYELDPVARLFESAACSRRQLPPRPGDLTDKLKLLAAVLALGKVEGQNDSSSGCEGLPGPDIGPTARQIGSGLFSGSEEGSTRRRIDLGIDLGIDRRDSDRDRGRDPLKLLKTRCSLAPLTHRYHPVLLCIGLRGGGLSC